MEYCNRAVWTGIEGRMRTSRRRAYLALTYEYHPLSPARLVPATTSDHIQDTPTQPYWRRPTRHCGCLEELRFARMQYKPRIYHFVRLSESAIFDMSIETPTHDRPLECTTFPSLPFAERALLQDPPALAFSLHDPFGGILVDRASYFSCLESG